MEETGWLLCRDTRSRAGLGQAQARNDDRKGYRLLTKKMCAEFDSGVNGGMRPMASPLSEQARHR